MKTNKHIIKIMLAGALVLFSFNSCKKSYLDINKNPNAPADVDVTLLLPSAEAAIGQALGNEAQTFGGIWGQYWTQNPTSSQYRNVEQYSPNAGDYDYPWSALYSNGLQDMKKIIDKATADKKTNYEACAKILQAYTYQLLTDNWGDIPLSDALKAEDGGTSSPKYDSQKDVYTGIINLLKDGLSDIDPNAVSPGTDDILFNGDMALWQEFGNTLLLRVYLRMAYVDPTTAQAGIAALGGAAFLGSGENVQINYINSGGNTNPLYATSSILGASIQNIVASATAINYMLNNNDPRIDVFYNPSSGGQAGLIQGDFNNQTATFSTPTTITGADMGDAGSASAPVKLMTSYESMFLQAEAAARGWLNGDAGALYNSAIAESFATWQLPDSAATAYIAQSGIAYPSSGSLEDKIQAIITQKWVSMCGTQCDEGWTEWRRTGYPNFFVVSKGTLLGPTVMPQRFFYPSVELTRNQNFPGQKLISDKVWWDVHQ